MEELNIGETLADIWAKRSIIFIVTVLFVAIAALYSFVFQVPKYQSSTKLVLTKVESNEQGKTSTAVTTTDVTINQKLVSTYSEIITSESVLNTVISNLNINGLTYNALKKNVKVTAVKDTEVIKITVSNENPKYAAKIANEIGKVFSAKISDMYEMNNVYILDDAKVDEEPYNIQPTKYIAIAFVAGIFVSCVGIVIASLFDTTVKSSEDIEKALKIPVISEIPWYDETAKKGGKK